ncbi:hypothetical protein NDU88_006373 [Pleurodeles waltl]|uniref:Uncharacterized protein n=1 Tax=Pleurodeles waltl TaxID=8319 RepID=A0AAV7X0Z2_PLEWA|nr:hypothetical protein NDU88_006373 [Pleurodeles waltl]
MTKGGAPHTGLERSVPAASLVRAAVRLQGCCLTCAHRADRRLVDHQRESLEGGGGPASDGELSPALPPEACRHHVGSGRALEKGRASPVARKRNASTRSRSPEEGERWLVLEHESSVDTSPGGRSALTGAGAEELHVKKKERNNIKI